MTFDEWLKIGIQESWVGPPVCSTHDGVPYSAAEEEEWDEGNDPCINILRLYEDSLQRLLVEENHSPSVWRGL
jgi:hypothetical protein